MNLREAIKAIYDGKKVALPEFGGYWFKGEDGGIKVHTKDDEITDTPWFGMYASRDDWEIVEGKRPIMPPRVHTTNNVTVTQEQVNENMKDVLVRTVVEFGKPCTYVTVRMKNGFTLRESTTCVDPANYSEEVGKKICLEKIEDKIWFLLGYSLQTVASAKNQELASTRDLMISPDYKERFQAEYIQLANRFKGLRTMCRNWDAGKLNFKPTCPRDLYEQQLDGMLNYLQVLSVRAGMEQVSLPTDLLYDNIVNS